MPKGSLLIDNGIFSAFRVQVISRNGNEGYICVPGGGFDIGWVAGIELLSGPVTMRCRISLLNRDFVAIALMKNKGYFLTNFNPQRKHEPRNFFNQSHAQIDEY